MELAGILGSLQLSPLGKAIKPAIAPLKLQQPQDFPQALQVEI